MTAFSTAFSPAFGSGSTDPPPVLPGLTPDAVKLRMGVPVLAPADDVWLADCVAWVAEYAEHMRTLNHLSQAQTWWAAVLQSMRLFQRRSSVQGVVTFDVGVALRISRSDPDIVLAYRGDYPRVG